MGTCKCTGHLHPKKLDSNRTYLFNCVCKQTLPRSPNRIVHSWKPLCKENLTRVTVTNCKIQLSKHQHNVLVKIVTNNDTDSAVTPTTMDKKQPMQVKELTDCVVCTSNCLSSLLTSDSNTNVSFHYHWHIVGTVTN
jgi:hypothetical protein